MPVGLPISEAAAVVIGAGAFGYSTAFHLAAAGIGQVVLLDRGQAGDGSSKRAAGLFKTVQADQTNGLLARRSREIVRGFSARTGVDLPYVASGSIFAARTATHAALIREEISSCLEWGLTCEEIDNAEAHRLASYLDASSLEVAYHLPDDLYIEEPDTMLRALHQAAERLAVIILGDTPALAIRSDRGEVTGVETPRGFIASPVVVDAAGAWARNVAATAGQTVNAATVRHQLAITAPIAGMNPDQPIVRVIDASAYVRPCRGGLLYGAFEPNPLPFAPPADDGWTISDLPLDSSKAVRIADTIQAFLPSLDNAGVSEVRGGLFTMTPDSKFLAGPVPGLRGFWLNTGCNGSGFSFAPAIGESLASWITACQPTFDMSTIAPQRLGAKEYSYAELESLGVYQYENYYTPVDVAARAGLGDLSRT